MPYNTQEKRKAYYYRKGKETLYKWRKKERRWNDYQREYARKKRGYINFIYKDWEERPAIDFDKLTYFDIKLLNDQIKCLRRIKGSNREKIKGNDDKGNSQKRKLKIGKKGKLVPVEKVNNVNWKAISHYANKAFIRPKAEYTNIKSPFGIADELHTTK